MRRTFIAVVLALAGAARADTIVVDDPPIATDYTDAQVDLHTRVTRITIDDPQDDACMDVTRVHGTISGVGRGGTSFALGPTGALVPQVMGLDAEYVYTVDFEYLAPRTARGAVRQNLTVSFHGGGGALTTPLDVEYPPPLRVANPANPLRKLHRALDRSFGRAAILDHEAYFAANRWLREDGGVVASYRQLVYDAALADAVKARYPSCPGSPPARLCRARSRTTRPPRAT